MNPKVTVIQPVTEENSNKIRVAAYCRVSSDSADQLNSFMVQMRYYENLFADSETEILAGIYADSLNHIYQPPHQTKHESESKHWKLKESKEESSS